MIRAIQRWLFIRRVLREQKRFNAGYSWALDILQTSNGQEDPSDRCDINPDHFDRGVLDACHDFYQRARNLKA